MASGRKMTVWAVVSTAVVVTGVNAAAGPQAGAVAAGGLARIVSLSPTVTVPVDTSTAGTVSVSVTVADVAGNVRIGACNVTVGYRFDGFRQPVDGVGLNTVKGGSNVPVKWRLVDANGVPVSESSSFTGLTVAAVGCATGAVLDEIEVTSNGSGLVYMGNGVWQYHWKTPKSPGCYTLSVHLRGTPSATAQFKLR